MLRAPTILALVLGLACAPATTAAPAPPAAAAPARLDLVIRGVRVFDGERIWPAAQVSVRAGQIVSIDDMVAAAATPEAAEVIDGAGMTLLPGLIDAHTHVQSPASLRQALRFGVTTELDMFALPAVFGPLRKLERGKHGAALADFRSAGILATAPGGHGTEYGFEIPTVTAPEEAHFFVHARIAEGSDYIKVVLDDGGALGKPIPTLSAEVLRALVDAAHWRGKLVVAHVSSQREAIMAIEAGVDGLAHVFFDAAPTPAFVQLAARRGVFVADTLAVVHSLCDGGRGRALAADPAVAALLGPGDARALQRSYHDKLKSPPTCDAPRRAVRELHAAGVEILASTDAPNPGTMHGASMHDELALLVEAGLTPAAALRAATSAPAQRFGLTDRGRLAPGQRADLLLVRGDPTQDIRATREIVGVWKRGVRLDLAAERAAMQAEHAALAALRAAPPPAGSESGRISDFDGGEATAAFGAGWRPATDALIGGGSTVELEVVAPGAQRSKHALRISGTVAASASRARWAGAMFFPGAAPMQPANLGRFQRVRLWARATAPLAMDVMLFAARNGGAPVNAALEVGTRWKQYTVDLSAFAELEPYDVTGLLFGATAPGSFVLELDDLRLE